MNIWKTIYNGGKPHKLTTKWLISFITIFSMCGIYFMIMAVIAKKQSQELASVTSFAAGVLCILATIDFIYEAIKLRKNNKVLTN